MTYQTWQKEGRKDITLVFDHPIEALADQMHLLTNGWNVKPLSDNHQPE